MANDKQIIGIRAAMILVLSLLVMACATSRKVSSSSEMPQEVKTEEMAPLSPITKEGGGIVHAGQIGVMIKAPAEWMFDSRSGVPHGLDAVMYPEGSTWENASERIYVNFSKLGSAQNLEAFIEKDIEGYREGSPNLRVEPGESIALKAGQVAVIRRFSGDRWGNWEEVAYLKEGEMVAMFVLACASEELFRKNEPLFRELVSNSLTMAMSFED